LSTLLPPASINAVIAGQADEGDDAASGHMAARTMNALRGAELAYNFNVPLLPAITARSRESPR
jgi:hypothetical protein